MNTGLFVHPMTAASFLGAALGGSPWWMFWVFFSLGILLVLVEFLLPVER